MKKEHKEIIKLLSEYLSNHPDQRFGQALFNLRINEFDKSTNTQMPNSIRDIHNDSDTDIIIRIRKQLEWFDLQEKVNNGLSNIVGLQGMTVNERLFASGLMETFEEMKNKNKEFARFILMALKVDGKSIEKILK
ncbi:hypothetical protein U6A24_18300 [Aquimarina gracilis]|uniref:Uncharacterized protein n=1 Tax=Aquimarina gracilis TaxID=874422 RepID=A0ABU6A036_9FLAO|nr:hypothetical protein [Aquimarina gracilis]MEB3347433.1 hypothetical protein [Aquimarina gracilis]